MKTVQRNADGTVTFTTDAGRDKRGRVAVGQRPAVCLRCAHHLSLLVPGDTPDNNHLVHSLKTVCAGCASQGEKT